MMSSCRSLQYDNLSKYPYVDESVSILDTDIKNIKINIDFVYQFVKNSYQYNTIDNYNKSYITDIIGPSKKYANFETAKHIFADPISATSYNMPLCTNNLTEQNQIEVINQNFITFEYHKAVYPIRITIYGTYEPEDIIRIWAQDYDNQWFLLYDNPELEEGLRVYMYVRNILKDSLTVLSLPIRLCHFKTKIFRLELNESNILKKHCTKLDAVMLVGTSELILPRFSRQDTDELLRRIRNNYKLNDVVESFHPLRCRCLECDQNRISIIQTHANISLSYSQLHNTSLHHLDIYFLQKNLHKYCITYKSNVLESFHKNQLEHKQVSQELNKYIYINYTHLQFLKQGYKGCFSIKDYSTYEKFIEDLKLLWDKSKESRDTFSLLPDEIILKILHNLDMRSLCRVSRVNKRLNNLSRDIILYTSLNIRNIYFTYWRSNLSNLLDYFTPRCKHLTYLDLSYCYFPVWKFNAFMTTCGTLLKRLILSYSKSIDDSALLKISKTCQILKDLDLNACKLINNKGFSHLKNLKCLERLHLALIHNIQTKTLCRILQNNRQMRDLNLAFTTGLNINKIAEELKNSCSNLERINLCNAASDNFTWEGINALADCKNLQEVNFRRIITYMYNKTSFYFPDDLPKLSNSFRRLFYSGQRLEKLDLSHNNIPDYSIALETLILCKNLKYLSLVSVRAKTPDIFLKILHVCKKLEVIDLRYVHCITNRLINQWRERYQNVLIINIEFA